VTLLWANNETGVLFPVEAVAALARSRGALFHSDAVQAVGRAPIDVTRLPLDLLSLSGHKLHAPSGIGALYVRKGVKLPPLHFGHQERGRRGGTENLPGAVALGVAYEQAAVNLANDTARMRALRDRLEQGLVQRLPWVRVHGRATARVANTSSVQFGVLEGEAILTRLDRLGVYAAAGAACAAGSTEPSHVLTAMGLERRAALATLRFSLSRYTPMEEIDRTLDLLPGVVQQLAAQAA
jgi:cysteine desulfurase